MARLGDLTRYYDPSLTLAAPGADEIERDYKIPLASAELGLWCRAVAETIGDIRAITSPEDLEAVADRASARRDSIPPLPGSENMSFEQLLLGSAHDAMMADGVRAPHIRFCAETAWVHLIGGEAAAAAYWESGGDPNRLRPAPANRAERRAQDRATTGKTSTAEASATPSPARTSGTRSRPRRGGRSRTSRSPGERS